MRSPTGMCAITGRRIGLTHRRVRRIALSSRQFAIVVTPITASLHVDEGMTGPAPTVVANSVIYHDEGSTSGTWGVPRVRSGANRAWLSRTADSSTRLSGPWVSRALRKQHTPCSRATAQLEDVLHEDIGRKEGPSAAWVRRSERPGRPMGTRDRRGRCRQRKRSGWTSQ